MRVVEESTLREQVKEAEALDSAERAFRALASGRVVQPPPLGLDIEAARGEVHVKGAYLLGSPIFAVKIASGFYSNPERGLPSGSGLVLVFDAATGFPLALLKDNAYLTDLRTAGAGALALKLLAPPSFEKLAVLGSGAQARYQLRALVRVGRWKKTSAWSPTASRLERYCREMKDALGRLVEPASSAVEAVRDADVVVTTTPSRAPLLEASSIESHATIIAVGSDGPQKQELPPQILARAGKVVADRISQCVEIGEIHHAVVAGCLRPEEVHAELGEILIGRKPGREADELIVCDLTGVGAQDAALAEVAWERLSLGVET